MWIQLPGGFLQCYNVDVIVYLVDSFLNCLLHKKPKKIYIIPTSNINFVTMIKTLYHHRRRRRRRHHHRHHHASPVDTSGFTLSNSVNSPNGLQLLCWVQQRLHLQS